jgi:hypothetical protein
MERISLKIDERNVSKSKGGSKKKDTASTSKMSDRPQTIQKKDKASGKTLESIQPKEMRYDGTKYFMTKGTPIQVLYPKGPVEVYSAQEDEQWMKEIFGPLKCIEKPTDAYNGFAEALIGKIGWLSSQMAEKVLFENFSPTNQSPETDDRLVYRNPETGQIDVILIVIKSDDGKLSAKGQMYPGRGFYIYYDLDHISTLLGIPEVYRQIEGTLVRSTLQCFAPGEDYVTTRGKRVRALYPTKDVLLRPPEAEKQWIAEKFRVKPPRIIEDPKPYNCFGHGILKKRGVIAKAEEADKAINDDFVIIEKTSQVGDWKICRNSRNLPSHMAEIVEMDEREVHKLNSKEGATGSLYEYQLDTLEKVYSGSWETRYKKTTVDNDLKRETSEYTTYKEVINNAIANPDSTSPFTQAEYFAILTVAEEFKKRAELGIEKSYEENKKNTEKHLELFRTRRLELLSVVKGHKKKEIYQPTAFDENDPDKQHWERYESLVMKQAKLDFENSLLRNMMETNGILPKDAQQTEERNKQASLIREHVVEAMLDGKEQGPALDEFDTFVQKQEQERKELFQTLNGWTKSLQQKVEQSLWPKELKNCARAYLNKLAEILTSPDETLRESFLYCQIEQSLGAFLKLSETDPN